MQAEQLRRRFVEMVNNLLLVVRLGADWRHSVIFGHIEVVLARQHLRAYEDAYESLDKPFVFPIRDTPALVDFGS